jgi:hypothetical protein
MRFPHKPGSGAPSSRPWSWGMQKHAVYLATLSLALLIAMMPTAFAAEEGNKGRGYLEIGGGFTTGDFGTSTRSSVYYFGPTLGYVSRSWDASVTVPYLFLSNGTTSQSSSVSRTSGVGDVILRGDGIFVPEGRAGFSLDAGLALKIPTANGTNGLGTGKADFGAFAGIHQRVGVIRISLFGGYVKVGSSSAVPYQDTPMYGVGVSGNLGRTNISASFEERLSIFPGVTSPHEVSLDLFRPLNRKLAIKSRTFFGLNKVGPDFGLSSSVVWWF